MASEIIVGEISKVDNKIKYKYTWHMSASTLRKSNLIEYNRICKSTEYKSENETEKSWRLNYYPWGHTIASMRFSRFQLILQNTNPSNELIITHVSIVNSDNEKIVVTNADDKILIPVVSNGNLYFDHCVKLEDIIDKLDKLMTNDCLKILIEIEQSTDNYSTITSAPQALPTCESSNNHCENQLQNGIFNFFLNKQFSDVTIEAQGKKFKAHRLILKLQSPVFSEMLDAEKSKRSKEHKIVFKNIEPEIVESMLEFIYSDREPKNIKNQAVKLLAVARKYKINKLEKICNKYLTEKIDEENAVRLLIFAHQSEAENLKTAAFNFIRENPSLLNSKDFKELEKSNPCLALEVMRTFVKRDGE